MRSTKGYTLRLRRNASIHSWSVRGWSHTRRHGIVAAQHPRRRGSGANRATSRRSCITISPILLTSAASNVAAIRGIWPLALGHSTAR